MALFMQITNARPTPNSGAIMSFENNILHDRKIAILATDGFDESQLFSPKKALEAAGAEVVIVSLNRGHIKSWEKDHWGKSIEVDATVNDCNAEEFDGLLIPGGEMNPQMLMHDKKVSDFVREFVYDGKSIASICHGTKVLIDSGMAKGKTLAAWPAMKKEVLSSGAKWRDDEIVAHKGLITTRCPDESPSFNKKMIEGFAIGPKVKRTLLH
ncbi:MAG: DJ-1/PfpI/YhbO family deglycase/protease [Rhizobacter sp.]|nr:DJ-1/PfpI/YhbO family deglycase/protease [Bacteriovorax sp.]